MGSNAIKYYDFPADASPEEVLAEIERSYSKGNPNIGKIQSIILKGGPRTYKFATFLEILDKNTRLHHHNCLNLKSFQKFKDGWQSQNQQAITLGDEAGDEIGLLEQFITEFRNYTQQEKKKYSVINSETYEKLAQTPAKPINDILSEILEDSDNYKMIVDQGGITFVQEVFKWIFKQRYSDAIVNELNSINVDVLQELTTVAGIAQINQLLDIWEQNKNNDNEEFWQKTLIEYSWIISQMFASPVLIFEKKAYLGGKGLNNKGGNIADLIYRNDLSKNLVLIELKTPCTEILGKRYRQTFSMSDETSGAVSQALNYKHSLQQNYYAAVNSYKHDYFEAINPKVLVVIGNFDKELKEDDLKIQAFELYRQNLMDINLITYDELFKKVSMLKSILQEGK